MQAPDNPVAGHGFIVLDETDAMPKNRSHLRVKVALGKTLEKIAPLIPEDPGLQDKHPFNIRLDDLHLPVNRSASTLQ